MELRIGDLVKVRPSPDVDPHMWEMRGYVAGSTPENMVVVDLETGEDCVLLPEQLLVLPMGSDPVANPFDIFPGPQHR